MDGMEGRETQQKEPAAQKKAHRRGRPVPKGLKPLLSALVILQPDMAEEIVAAELWLQRLLWQWAHPAPQEIQKLLILPRGPPCCHRHLSMPTKRH